MGPYGFQAFLRLSLTGVVGKLQESCHVDICHDKYFRKRKQSFIVDISRNSKKKSQGGHNAGEISLNNTGDTYIPKLEYN